MYIIYIIVNMKNSKNILLDELYVYDWIKMIIYINNISS